METSHQYKIVYTETAIRDMEEKMDYIACRFRDASLAMAWYVRLRDAIWDHLKTMPHKYLLYQEEPWRSKGVRLLVFRSDVVLYSVDERQACVYIRAVCTKGRDLPKHLGEQNE